MTAARAAVVTSAIAACALFLGACATQHVGSNIARSDVARSDGGVLIPDARELSTAHFRAESETAHVVADSGAGTSAHAIGSSLTSIQPTRYQGHDALVFTRISRRGSQEFMDTTLVLRDGLVPVWEVASNSRGWHARFDYDGPTVRVEAVSPDSTHRAAHTYPHPVFNFNEVDAIVRSVPLQDGYHTIVPLYSEGDDGLEMDTMSVSAPRDGGTWSVRFADPVIISHYAIDGATRRITGLDVTYHKRPVRVHYHADSTATPVGR